MTLKELTILPERLWSGEEFLDQPCVFVMLDQLRRFQDELRPPPIAVIGIGDVEPPPTLCDVVVSNEAEAVAILRGIEANPRAAAVIVSLLRLLPNLSLEQGLVAESLAYGVLQGSEEHARWLAPRQVSDTSAAPGQVAVSRDDNCLSIILDRPDADNAIDRPMRDQLFEALSLAVLDDSITRICLSGAGRSFSLGADLNEFGTTRDPATAHSIRQHTLPALQAAKCADRLEVHIQGACVGAGLELAAFARRITASPRAWFQLPEMAMGVLPGAGGCVSLTRRIGRHRTAELILSGKRLSARKALAWGIIDAVVDDGAADDGSENIV
jgi:enoyl-CoA hydratase/carnithine racemase